MKKTIYILGFALVSMGIYSCGESRTVVVGEGESSYNTRENEIKKQEVEQKLLEKKSEKVNQLRSRTKFQIQPNQIEK